MDIKLPSSVKINEIPISDQDPIDWLENKYVSVDRLFPKWLMAESMLRHFVSKTGDWVVYTCQGEINISLKFPFIEDESSGTMIPMIEIFPEWEREQVKEICDKLMSDYTPNLDKCYSQKIPDHVVPNIINEIRCRENHIINCGGRRVHEELMVRLGIYVSTNFSLKFNI